MTFNELQIKYDKAVKVLKDCQKIIDNSDEWWMDRRFTAVENYYNNTKGTIIEETLKELGELNENS